jgi:hypothetical protein
VDWIVHPGTCFGADTPEGGGIEPKPCNPYVMPCGLVPCSCVGHWNCGCIMHVDINPLD